MGATIRPRSKPRNTEPPLGLIDGFGVAAKQAERLAAALSGNPLPHSPRDKMIRHNPIKRYTILDNIKSMFYESF